ncbi:hypothetical protein KAR91_24360 [Candidatus Pacearchaeota archaeon]|nr:hypothetical protein [Candidatus Pacearchaeota archaeon]
MGGYKIRFKITVKVLAEVSGRCETTVRRHIKSGKLDFVSFESIQKWLRENKREAEEGEQA